MQQSKTGQRHLHFGATTASLAGDLDRAPMQVYELARDRQANSQSSPGIVGALS